MAKRTWQAALLKYIGAPVSKRNVEFLTTWQRWEGGHTNNDASYNWLNTTHGPGKAINSVGVKAFPNFAVGIRSLGQTLKNGRYNNLVAAFKKGNPYDPSVSGDLQTWVSGSSTGNPGYAQKLLGGGTLPAESPVATGGAIAPVPPLPSWESLWEKEAPSLGQDFAYIRPFKIPKGAKVSPFGYTDPGGSLVGPKGGKGIGGAVVSVAGTQIGKPYLFGSGPDTSSFDCSDLIQWSYEQVGIDIPRTTYEQIKIGRSVKGQALQPGDLIFPHEGHVVMYVGNGKVIAAPRTGTVVQYQPVPRNPLEVRRIL